MSEFHDHVISYTLKGRGAFPVDMLRYDACYPATETDSSRIIASHTPHHHNEVEIRVSGWRCTEARWASFGWKVVAS